MVTEFKDAPAKTTRITCSLVEISSEGATTRFILLTTGSTQWMLSLSQAEMLERTIRELRTEAVAK